MTKPPLTTVARKLPLAIAIGLLSLPVSLQAANSQENYCQSAGAENDYSCTKATTFQANQKTIDARLDELNRWLENEAQAQAGIQAKTSQPDSIKLQQKIEFNSRLLAQELKQARMLQSKGDQKGAFDQVNSYLADNPKDPNGWLLYGVSLINQNKLDGAADVFRKLIRLYPDSPEPYNNLAAVYARKGENDKAVEVLLQAFDTHPSYAQVQANLKTVYAALATQAYNRALDLDNVTEGARADLAVLDQVYLPDGIIQPPAAQQIAAAPQQPTPQLKPVPTPQPAAEEPSLPAPPTAAAASPAPKTAEKLVIEERDVSEGTVPEYTDQQPAQSAPEETTETVVAKAESSAQEQVATAKPTEADVGLNEQLTSEIKSLIVGWASAWSAQDVESYLRYYTSNYSPDSKITHQQWTLGRNKRLTKPSYIQIDISNISLAEMTDGRIRSVFQQGYQSNTYQDRVYKTLIFTREQGNWKIASETTL